MLNNLTLSKNNTKIYLSVAGFLAAAGLLVFLGLVPLVRQDREMRSLILANRAVIARQETQISAFREAEQKLSEVAASLPQIRDLFPIREKSVILVEAVEDAVARSEVAAKISITDKKETESTRGGEKNETPAVTANLKNIEQVPYTLSVAGTYRNLVDLFLYLENLPFFTALTDLNIAAESEGSGDGTTLSKTGLASGNIKGIFFIWQK